LFEPRPLVFILHPDDAPALGTLNQTFPDGSARRIQSQTSGRDFFLFIVPAP